MDRTITRCDDTECKWNELYGEGDQPKYGYCTKLNLWISGGECTFYRERAVDDDFKTRVARGEFARG